VTVLLVVLLSAIPVAACGYLGARWGGRRIGALLLGGACGAALGFWGLRLGWSRPFGLLTPLVAALLASAAVAGVALRRFAADPAPTTRSRRIGAGLGAICGVAVAGSLWTAAALGEGIAASPQPRAEPAERGWVQALVHTANHGFVRHLPLLGPLSDEVEATIEILNAPAAARRQLAEGRQWERLTELDSYRELAGDEEVAADLAAFRRGNVLALYRLQRNRRVITFMREEQVRALLPTLRPTTLARELE